MSWSAKEDSRAFDYGNLRVSATLAYFSGNKQYVIGHDLVWLQALVVSVQRLPYALLPGNLTVKWDS